jgi:hypothetical protein
MERSVLRNFPAIVGEGPRGSEAGLNGGSCAATGCREHTTSLGLPVNQSSLYFRKFRAAW